MVFSLPRRISRGIAIALTLTCAHTPLSAEPWSGESASASTRDAAKSGGDLLGNQKRTRFLVGLPKNADFSVFALSNSNRVVIEVSEVKLRLPAQPKGNPIGLVKSFRAGVSGPDRSRIIINVTEPVIVASAKMEKAKDGRSQQLIVEMVPFGPRQPAAVASKRTAGVVTASIGDTIGDIVNAVTDGVSAVKDGVASVATGSGDDNGMPRPTYSLGAVGLQPPSPRPAVSPEVLAKRAFKPVIVIDPGHGGHDSGAMKNGVVEKDIVLAFGKILAKKLKATGRFKVLMTRDTDVFVPLGERVDYAEAHSANLFIAIHCDYANSSAKGATIYSLRDSLADRLQDSTAREVKRNVLSDDEENEVRKASGNVSVVRDILADLAGREVQATRDRTSVFARSVIENMGASTDLREDPDKQAGFRVLKTAQFPSVLIELAYVTNKQDAANLMSDSWRDKVSDSIMTAIDNYFSNQLAQLPM